MARRTLFASTEPQARDAMAEARKAMGLPPINSNKKKKKKKAVGLRKVSNG